MSVASRSTEGGPGTPVETEAPSARWVLDLSKVDMGQRMYSREDIQKYIPHRGQMALLDSIVWENQAHTQGVAIKHVRKDEFWVPGHFPDKALMPAVLMIEAGAQLACFLYNVRMPQPKIIAFIHLNDCSFRAMVQPGDDLYLLCNEVKFGKRRFVSDIQGMAAGRMAFEARISGMIVDQDTPPPRR